MHVSCTFQPLDYIFPNANEVRNLPVEDFHLDVADLFIRLPAVSNAVGLIILN